MGRGPPLRERPRGQEHKRGLNFPIVIETLICTLAGARELDPACTPDRRVRARKLRQRRWRCVTGAADRRRRDRRLCPCQLRAGELCAVRGKAPLLICSGAADEPAARNDDQASQPPPSPRSARPAGKRLVLPGALRLLLEVGKSLPADWQRPRTLPSH
jgi:hypothetical protein